MGECISGFWKNETGSADVSTMYVVDNAENATYTCTSADSTQLQGECMSGFGKMKLEQQMYVNNGKSR